MRPIDADRLEKDVLKPSMFDINKDDVIALIAEQPTIDADAYFDAVDRIKPCPNCRYTHIHKMFSENGQTPWKSFAEEEPKSEKRYIAYVIRPDGTRDVFDLWYDSGIWYVDAGEEEYEGKVTHWMHLPMGPEEERA